MGRTFWALILVGLLASCSGPSDRAKDELSPEAFASPPDSAKPRVWWHWVNGNVSWDGARQDIEWMHRVGVGGIQAIDASLGGPQVMPERVGYMSPAWRDTFKKSVELAASYGMDVSISASPGFSLTGGPWVKPEQAMKKLVWSEITVEGGKRLAAPLPAPPSAAGPFQDVPATSPAPVLYRDVAVLAFPAAIDDALKPAITASAGALDAARLSNGLLSDFQDVPVDASGGAWVRFTFAQPQTVRAFSFVVGRAPGLGPFPATGPGGLLEASTDGATWRSLSSLPTDGADQLTIAFAPVTAKYYRLTLEPIRSLAPSFGPPPPAPTAFKVAELVLHAEARVHRWEDKAGYSSQSALDALATPAEGAATASTPSRVIDLTAKLRRDGTLDWTPPAGRWTIVRFGYSLTGRMNNPAGPEATGLEVDKLSSRHVKAYMDSYLGAFADTLGPKLMGSHGLKGFNVDSWEVGVQNWTDDMPAQFKKRRGYDLTPWLPALTGRIVGDAAATERFLWDFRRTIGELTTDEHFGQIARSLRERGMTGAVETHEQRRVFIGDGMSPRKYSDTPMAAIWIEQEGPVQSFAREMDLREAASVAHVWGKPIVAAESFTALGNPYGYSPAEIKPTADKLFASGINQIYVHTSVHQAADGAGPGLTLGPFGLWFTRRETWAEQAGPWLTYLARSSWLLRQGKPVSDIAYFYGEDDNVTALYGEHAPAIPEGYGYDFVNADALLRVLSVRNGKLATPSGMTYRLLVLGPEARRMTLPVLRRIRALAAQGVVIVGEKPEASPALKDDPQEFRLIADALWAPSPSKRQVRQGDVATTLHDLGISPDMFYSRPQPDTHLMFIHRATDDADIYFISNRQACEESLDLRFRKAGKAPEIWRADTGTIANASYRTDGAETVVPVKLAPNDALFVVFRRAATSPAWTAPEAATTPLATLNGPWDLSFPEGRGAPPVARLATLASWTENKDPGIRYFSGVATYSIDLAAPADWMRDSRRLVLNLGAVKNIAEVRVNGQPAGTAWTAPFEVDVTNLLKPGPNKVEIKVANLWGNRLIGDKQPGAKPIASAAFDPFPPNAPLAPSGLLGPVTLNAIDQR
ncbi:MAG TPA: glycosyl hydrolase [Hyphomonadaceae bacterium]|nr:glycosyl hydrolase [Hyphomonadaceae bacterium]